VNGGALNNTGNISASGKIAAECDAPPQGHQLRDNHGHGGWRADIVYVPMTEMSVAASSEFHCEHG
jgi:hypothetical protein